MVNTDIDDNFLYSDACVESIICDPQGPCKYNPNEGCFISDNIIKGLVKSI